MDPANIISLIQENNQIIGSNQSIIIAGKFQALLRNNTFSDISSPEGSFGLTTFQNGLGNVTVLNNIGNTINDIPFAFRALNTSTLNLKLVNNIANPPSGIAGYNIFNANTSNFSIQSPNLAETGVESMNTGTFDESLAVPVNFIPYE